jgi:hypothetical protein
MTTEREKMISGALYDAADPDLVRSRRRARDLLRAFNASRDDERDERLAILVALFGAIGEGLTIEPPFFCDYGVNITLGRRVDFNVNCVILDPAPVTIGSDVFFGPSVQLALHRGAPAGRPRAAERPGDGPADRDRLGRLDRRGVHPVSGGASRRGERHRRRQRRHPRHRRGGARGGQSVPDPPKPLRPGGSPKSAIGRRTAGWTI